MPLRNAQLAHNQTKAALLGLVLLVEVERQKQVLWNDQRPDARSAGPAPVETRRPALLYIAVCVVDAVAAGAAGAAAGPVPPPRRRTKRRKRRRTCRCPCGRRCPPPGPCTVPRGDVPLWLCECGSHSALESGRGGLVLIGGTYNVESVEARLLVSQQRAMHLGQSLLSLAQEHTQQRVSAPQC